MANTEYTVSLPFTLGFTGSVETTIDQTKIWSDKVLTVVGTALGERTQRYYFGSKVHFEAFENVEQAKEGIEKAVSEAFSAYLPLLTFRGIRSSYSPDTGQLNVTILYSLPDEALSEVKIGNVQIDGNQPPKEF
jgi:phage baseplate assembly protein W